MRGGQVGLLYNKPHMLKRYKKTLYLELGYKQPSIDAKHAATRAIKVIEAAQAHDVGWMLYLLQHSHILFLAGLRAQSPYLSFSPLMTPARLRRFRFFLAEHNIELVGNELSFEDRARTYSFVHPRLVSRLPETYTFLKQPDFTWHAPSGYTTQAMVEWCYGVERYLASAMESDSLPKKWLFDWWAPHNIRFGMLLGYPGPAISSFVWARAKEKHSGHEEHLSYLSVQQKDELLGTEVGFEVANPASKHREVHTTMAVWEEVIRLVVHYFESKELGTLTAFTKEYKALKKG